MDDLMAAIRSDVLAAASTEVQRRYFARAIDDFAGILDARGSHAMQLDCVRVPRLIYYAAGGQPGPIEQLLKACLVFFIGVSLWDDAMDGDLTPSWRDESPVQVALTAAALIGGVAPTLLARPSIPATLRGELQRLMAACFTDMTAGQQLDRWLVDNPAADPATARRCAELKSGAAYRMYASTAAALAGAPDEGVCGFAAYGLHLGTAHQLQQDMADVQTRLSETLAGGQRTLPLAWMFALNDEVERPRLHQLLVDARQTAILSHEVRWELARVGAVERAERDVIQLMEDGLLALDAVQPSPLHLNRLRGMLAFICIPEHHDASADAAAPTASSGRSVHMRAILQGM